MRRVQIDSSSSDVSLCKYDSNKRKKLDLPHDLREIAICIDSSSLSSDVEQSFELKYCQHQREEPSDMSKNNCVDDLNSPVEVHTQEEASATNIIDNGMITANLFEGCGVRDSISSVEVQEVASDYIIPNLEEEILSLNIPLKNMANSSTNITFSGKNFKDDLRKYALFAKIPHVKLKPLLEMLRLYNHDVPVDPRTLLKTPRTSKVKRCQFGVYMHFGLTESVQTIITKNSNKQLPNILNLGIGIDDVPTYKGISITLILGCIDEIEEVFIIGMFGQVIRV